MAIYGGWNRIENGTLTGEWQWGLDFPDAVTAKANGWFPDLDPGRPIFDRMTQGLVTSRTLQGDVVSVGYTVVELSADEAKAAKRAAIVAALATSDAAYKPRWAEDARRGQAPHESEQAWLDEREALRGQLAAL